MNKEIPHEVERFNLIFRLQHIALFVSFLILAFSGWALKYPELEYSRGLLTMWGSAETAGLVHRIAGVAMLITFIWHVTYMVYLIFTGKIKINPVTTLIPIPKDVTDLLQNYMYFLGLSKEKPRFGRFSYLHKFDYWAVFWGMAIIGVSGFVLAFPVFSSQFFPNFTLQWIWPLMRILHSDEALLAIGFILFIHFYSEHLRPGKFPMSWIWLTGKISTEEMKHEHPLEYEEMFGRKIDD